MGDNLNLNEKKKNVGRMNKISLSPNLSIEENYILRRKRKSMNEDKIDFMSLFLYPVFVDESYSTFSISDKVFFSNGVFIIEIYVQRRNGILECSALKGLQ